MVEHEPATRHAGDRPRVPFSREVKLAVGLWIVLTLAGQAIVWVFIRGIMPERYAETATIVDDAFLYLTALAVPVFAFVISAVTVSLVRFRSKGEPEDDGPAVHGDRRVFGWWLGITGTLAASLIVFPGLVGLVQLGNQENVPTEDLLVVRVQAARWAWTIDYPAAGVTSGEELVLPVDQPVRFEISSVDIVHSFWIPAFRVKIDAVPGKTTTATLTPERAGSFETDPMMRIQCAELCGLNHSTMAMPVRVLEPAEFDAWLQGSQAGAEADCEPEGTELQILAKDIEFDPKCLAAEAGIPFTITLDNQDDGIPHNISISTDAGWTDVLYTSETFNGIETRTFDVPALDVGDYFFRCDVHPIPAMSGAFVVAEPQG
jgi:cytochrome c oxidase subunit 2